MRACCLYARRRLLPSRIAVAVYVLIVSCVVAFSHWLLPYYQHLLNSTLLPWAESTLSYWDALPVALRWIVGGAAALYYVWNMCGMFYYGFMVGYYDVLLTWYDYRRWLYEYVGEPGGVPKPD